MPLLIVTGSLDTVGARTTNGRDGQKKRLSVLKELGKDPSLWRIVVTLIPPRGHFFSLKDVRLELGGILKGEK